MDRVDLRELGISPRVQLGSSRREDAESELKAQFKELRLEGKDTYSRIHSIAKDSDFVEIVKSAFPEFPVVPNLRCGAWYVRPTRATPYCYFKSTDGHIGVHKFSLRRVNLSLLPVILKHQGIAIVDSTRRGKRFPDSLSKTIPIWCAVLNQARSVLRSRRGIPPDTPLWLENAKLWTSPAAVGRSEHSQIERKIEEWAVSLADSAYDLSDLLTLSKPLRPLFLSPASSLPASGSANDWDFCPVFCVSASKLIGVDEIDRQDGFVYLQGIADDEETWSKGLTSELFWQNYDILLAATRSEIDDLVQAIVQAHRSPPRDLRTISPPPVLSSFRQVRSTRVFLDFGGPKPTTTSDSRTLVIKSTTTTPASLPILDPLPDATEIVLAARIGKVGYASFFARLPQVVDFFVPPIQNDATEIIIAAVKCSDPEQQSGANDLGVALAIILLVQLYDDSGIPRAQDQELTITKAVIRTRLIWILERFPTLNPSRAILIAVNAYLMSKNYK